MDISEERIRLPAEPTSPALARRFVARHLEARGADEVVDVGTLLTSEVVTNAVVHAGGPIDVEVAADGRAVRVCVLDHDPRPPVPRPASGEHTTGRGLALVDALAARWGSDRVGGDGKRVWFELDLGC